MTPPRDTSVRDDAATISSLVTDLAVISERTSSNTKSITTVSEAIVVLGDLVRRDNMRLDASMTTQDKAEKTLEQTRKDTAEQFLRLENRITESQTCLKREILSAQDSQKFDMEKRIDSLAERIQEQFKVFREELPKMATHEELHTIITTQDKIIENQEKQSNKIAALERWRWYVVGVAGTAIFLITTWPTIVSILQAMVKVSDK